MAEGYKKVTPASDLLSIQAKHDSELGKLEGEMMLDALKDPITGAATIIADSATVLKSTNVIKEDLANTDYLAKDEEGNFVNERPTEAGKKIQKFIGDRVGSSLQTQIKEISENVLGGLDTELKSIAQNALEDINGMNFEPSEASKLGKEYTDYLKNWQSDPNNKTALEYRMTKDKDGNLVATDSVIGGGRYKIEGLLSPGDWMKQNNKTTEESSTEEIIEDTIPNNQLGVLSNTSFFFEKDRNNYTNFYANYKGDVASSGRVIEQALNKMYTTLPGNVYGMDKNKYRSEPFMRQLILQGSTALYKSLYGDKSGYQTYNQFDLQPGDLIENNQIFKREEEETYDF